MHARSYSRLMSRHAVIVGGALALAGAGPLSRTGSAAEKSFLLHGLPEAAYDSRRGTLCRAKRVDQAHYRPPNYETPPTHFTSEFTPNESFIRYHLAAFGKKSTPRSGAQSDGDGVGGHWNWVARFAISNQDLLRLWLVMRRMSLVFFVFGIAGSSASGQAPSTTDDVRKGRHLALMLCTDCHLVAPEQPYRRNSILLRPHFNQSRNALVSPSIPCAAF